MRTTVLALAQPGCGGPNMDPAVAQLGGWVKPGQTPVRLETAVQSGASSPARVRRLGSRCRGLPGCPAAGLPDASTPPARRSLPARAPRFALSPQPRHLTTPRPRGPASLHSARCSRRNSKGVALPPPRLCRASPLPRRASQRCQSARHREGRPRALQPCGRAGVWPTSPADAADAADASRRCCGARAGLGRALGSTR